jgi:predicted ATPase
MEAARAAHRQGAAVLVGHCDDGLAVPYQPFAEVMAKAVRHLPAADLASLLGGRGGELVRLVPDLAELSSTVPVPLSSDPETDRYRMFEATGHALSALARRAPVVLVLDDLHWATKPTLLLLRHLTTRVDPMPLLIVGTYRDTEVGESHPVTDVLGERMPDVTRIRLTGLGEDDVRGFVEALDGGDTATSARRARSLYDVSAGNALFMREMARHLDESGSGDAGSGDVPESVREVVRRRLSRLSATTNRLLSVASVVGAEYELDVIQVAVGFDEDSVLSGLEEATQAGLVADVAGPRLRQRFTHALVRDVLYDELSAGRRAQLHRRGAPTTCPSWPATSRRRRPSAGRRRRWPTRPGPATRPSPSWPTTMPPATSARAST